MVMGNLKSHWAIQQCQRNSWQSVSTYSRPTLILYLRFCCTVLINPWGHLVSPDKCWHILADREGYIACCSYVLDNSVTTLEQFWDNSGTTLEQLWGNSGQHLDNSGTTLEQLLDNSGRTRALGQHLDNCGTTLAQLWNTSWITLGHLWNNCGTTLEQLWDNSGTTLEQFWDNSGTALG